MSGHKRIPAMQQRLDRWALWVYGASAGRGGCGSTLGYLMDLAAGRRVVADDDAPHRSMVPVDNIECSRTDDAVHALPPDLQRAVRAWHLTRSGTLEEVAHRNGIAKATLWRRLAQADHRLDAWLYDRVRASCRNNQN